MPRLTLQHPFSYAGNVFPSIARALTDERLRRYLRHEPPGADLQRAFRLYLWNIQLSEAFYAPLHIAEVCIRNALQEALQAHYRRADWYEFSGFKCLLSANIKSELEAATDRARREHGAALTPDLVIAALPFGFWSHVLSRNFEKIGIWPAGFRIAFPERPRGLQTERIHYRVEVLRDFRNRIAHHMAVYDHDLHNIKKITYELVGWRSPQIRLMLEEISELSRIDACISGKPPV